MPYCSNCAHFNADSHAFCEKCGTRLVAAAPVQPTAPPAQVQSPAPAFTNQQRSLPLTKIVAAVVALALVAGGTYFFMNRGSEEVAVGITAEQLASAEAIEGTLIISSDLPLQGSAQWTNDSTNAAIRLYLEQINYTVAGRTIQFITYDNATYSKGSWDDATCAMNAQEHVRNTNEVAVIGTYNSGCAKIIVPVLNQDPNGPMLMVSHANTNPGLTRTWDPGEPEKYYPTGIRNYARVITTDDVQGVAAAQYARNELGLNNCFVLDDGQTYGRGTAKAFADEAKRLGISIAGTATWDGYASNYSSLFNSVKSANPDCVYLGGIFDNNGAQLIRDKVRILGSNSTVALLGPDGFTGYPDLTSLPQAQGMYLTFAGLSADLISGANAQKFIRAYQSRYGSRIEGSYPIYAVAALQVVLEAIERSGDRVSRRSVTNAVFSGNGITIPASKSIFGKAFGINPKTGEVDLREVTVLQVRNYRENTVKALTIR